MSSDGLDRGTVRVAFVCRSCGERLAVERDGESFVHDEFHGCFGDTPGLIGMHSDDQLHATMDGVRLEVLEDGE